MAGDKSLLKKGVKDFLCTEEDRLAAPNSRSALAVQETALLLLLLLDAIGEQLGMESCLHALLVNFPVAFDSK